MLRVASCDSEIRSHNVGFCYGWKSSEDKIDDNQCCGSCGAIQKVGVMLLGNRPALAEEWKYRSSKT